MVLLVTKEGEMERLEANRVKGHTYYLYLAQRNETFP